MNYNFKNNLIGLVIACSLFFVSTCIFVAFVNSDIATSSDIDTSTKSKQAAEAKYYRISDGNISVNTEVAKSDVANNFANIQVFGTIKDDMGILDFTMTNANIKANYRNNEDEGNTKEYFSYQEVSYDSNKKYRVDSDFGDEQMFQGYVYYNQGDDDEEKKELCSHLRSNGYFEMVYCEDESNVYTTINTASMNETGSINNIANNALYQFDKKSHETRRLCDINIHNDNMYIYDIACNDNYLYVLISKSNELYVKVYDKDSYTEEKEVNVEVKANISEFADKMVKTYDVRDIADYEVVDEGYELYANDNGLVVINKKVVAEIESSSGKHYGEKGYATTFEEKGLEPYVKELYKVSSYKIDGKEVDYDSAYVSESTDIFDFVYYKDGVTYVLTNENDVNAGVVEKIRVTAMKDGKLLDQIYINLNKISDTSGTKELKYIGVE